MSERNSHPSCGREGAKCDEALGLGISVGTARFAKPAALSAVIEMLENRRK